MLRFGLLFILLSLAMACRPEKHAAEPAPAAPPDPGQADPLSRARQEMVDSQLRRRGISDQRVLEVMARVPRHRFVPADVADLAYGDSPLPIGLGQTISQPYIVAYMTEQARLQPGDRVLEIGTGSGYQAAILAELVKEVYTIELLGELGRRAAATLESLGLANVHCRIGNGYDGWPEAAPFDAILVTAAPEDVPPKLVEQLRPGGRMVLPVGLQGAIQSLVRLVKEPDGRIRRESLLPVRFVPMVDRPADK